MQKVIAAIVVVLAAVGAFYYFDALRTNNSSAGKEIRWLVAHEPVRLFEPAIAAFSSELSRSSSSTYKVTMLSPKDFGVTGRSMKREEVEQLIAEGKIDMASVRASDFQKEHSSLGVFEVPYLFSSYEQAEKFFGTPQSAELLKEVSDTTSLTALAFTYSGGFRNIALLKGLTGTLSSLAGEQITTGGGLVTQGALSTVYGLSPKSIWADGDTEDAADVRVADITYTRVASHIDSTPITTVIETNHGLHTTMIVATDTLIESLPANAAEAIRVAATNAAAIERADSRTLADQTEQKLEAKGVIFVPVSAADESAYAKKAQTIEQSLPTALVEAIKGLK